MRKWLLKFFSELFIRDSGISPGGAGELSCLAAERGPWRRISTLARPVKAPDEASSAAGPGCAGCGGQGAAAMHSISTFAPSASPLPATVERAGGAAVK